MNNEYQPINCDDYEQLELACLQNLTLAIVLRDGEAFNAKAIDLLQKKHVEYLAVEQNKTSRELRLDHIHRFCHPNIGTVTVSLSD